MLQVIKRKKYSKIIIAILSMCIAFGLFLAPKQQSKSVNAANEVTISISGDRILIEKSEYFMRVDLTVIRVADSKTYTIDSYNDDFVLLERIGNTDGISSGDDFEIQAIATKTNGDKFYSNTIYWTYWAPVELPPDPVKLGYTFVGWYYDEAFTQPYDGAPIYENTVLYAKFIINQCTITFDSRGGSNVASITQNFDTTITAPTSPTRIGNTFNGWYTDEACTQAFDFATKMPPENITLYAKWTAQIFTVTFMVDGAVYNTLEVAYGTILQNDTQAAGYMAAMGELFTNAEKKTDLIPHQ